MSLNLRSSGTPLTQNELDNNLTFLYSRDITGSTVTGTTLFLYKQDGTSLSAQLPQTSPGSPINSIQFNGGSGVFSGSSNFTFNPSTNLVSLIGNLSITGSSTSLSNTTNGGVTNFISNNSSSSLAYSANGLIAGRGGSSISATKFLFTTGYSTSYIRNTELTTVETIATVSGGLVNSSIPTKQINFIASQNSGSVFEWHYNTINSVDASTVRMILSASTGNLFTSGSYSTTALTLRNTPTLNNSGTQILIRNSSTGNIEYRDFSTISGGTSIDTFTTGFTYSNNNLTISRNQGQPPLSVTINNFTGLTVNGSLSASTYLGLPSSTFTGNTSASCITDLYVSNIYGCSPITVHDSVQSVGSSATGITSFAFGNTTVAIGIASHAEGDSTQAIGIASHAEGSGTIANGNNSHAEGENTTTVGEGSHVEGYGTLTGQYFYTLDSVVAGVLTINSGYGDVSSQFSTAVIIEDAGSIFYYKIDSTIFDSFNTIIYLADTSVNSGTNVGVPGIPTPVGADILLGIGYSHAEGQNTSATGGYSHAEGNGTNAIGFDSHAEGNGTITVGVGSHTEGYVTQAIGDYSHAEGTGTQAIGGGSHAEGDTTLAIGSGSHTEGSSTQAIGIGSHAEGRTSVAIGAYSHSEGNGTFSGAYAYLVSGTSGNNIVLNPSYGDVTSQFTSSEVFVYNSLGIGGEVLNFSATSYNNITSATTVVVSSTGLTIPYYILPNPNETTIYNPLNADQNIGIYSHAEGFGTQAIGAASHAEGNRTTAIGISSHAEGGNTQAIGVYSHAEGNYTQAFGDYSHSQGVSTIASGNYSFASGSGSTAQGISSFVHSSNSVVTGDRSVVLGGQGISGTSNDFVYVSNLNINSTPVSNPVATQFLVRNSSTGNVEYRDASTISGGTSTAATFTGNTSASCITDLYVSNLYGCSPITIHDSIQNFGSSATGITSFAFGNTTVATGDYSHAEGEYTQAIGTSSHAEGGNSQAIGDYSHTEGNYTQAFGDYSHAEGQSAFSGAYAYLVSGTSSGNDIVLNPNYGDVTSEFTSSVVFVYNTSSSAAEVLTFSSTSYDSITSATTVVVTAIGLISPHYILPNPNETGSYNPLNSDQIIGTGSHAEGISTQSIGNWSHAEGGGAQAIGVVSHAEGEFTQAIGYGSHAEGVYTQANGIYSHAEGNYTQAFGDYSHSQGILTRSNGDYSFASGSGSTAQGISSFVHSSNSVVTGDRSVVLGGQGISGTSNDFVYVSNLNINSTPVSNSGGTQVLVRNSNTGNIEYNSSIKGPITSVGNGTVVTGITNQYSKGLLIPANSRVAGDVPQIDFQVTKTGSAGNLQLRFYWNVVNSLSGSPILIGTTLNGAANWFAASRLMCIEVANGGGNGTKVAPTTVVLTTGWGTATAAPNVLAIDWTQPGYLICAVLNSSAADSTVCQMIKLF